MNTSASHPDPVAAFNALLAQAKLTALRTIDSLMAILTRPDKEAGPAIRELRLLATTILRTQPMKPADAPPAAAPRAAASVPETPKPTTLPASKLITAASRLLASHARTISAAPNPPPRLARAFPPSHRAYTDAEALARQR